MLQDEERMMILEKEKDNVRYILYHNDICPFHGR